MVRRQWLAERPPTAPDVPSEDAAANPKTPLPPAGSVRARALDEVARIAASLHLTAAVAPAEAGQLGMRVTDAQGTSLTLYLEPVRAESRYYKREGRLGLWYAREKIADASTPAWAAALLKATADRLLAPDFDGIADELAVRPNAASDETEVPIAQEAAAADPYARAKVLGPKEVEHFFHVDYQFEPGTDVYQPPTTRIGIIYQCNQPCTFCQLAEMNTHIPPARIYAALDASRARGAERVILTGGEPTLCRDLIDYVAYARAHGFTTIELQTNATLLDRGERARALREAGLTDAQVSLHGPDSEISDRLTAAPGTHQRTLAGIGNLLDCGVRVLLNHLIFRDNCHLLLDFIEMVERRWGRHRERLIIQFHAPLSEFARVEHARRHIARYTDYAVLLRRAIDRGRELGYWVKDLQDPTGIPALCVLSADPGYLGPILSQRDKPRMHKWETSWMTRVAECARCEIADACMGIPKGYIALHGDAEFHAVKLSELS